MYKATELSQFRGMLLGSSRIAKVVATGLAVQPDFCPEAGAELVIYYLNQNGHQTFQLCEQNFSEGNPSCTLLLEDSMANLNRKYSYFSGNSDIVRLFGIRSRALRHMIQVNAPQT